MGHSTNFNETLNEMNYENIDQYIAKQPESIRLILQKIRDAIKVIAPEAEEKINYGIPAISLVKGGKRESQIMFAAYKKHIGFYPFPTTMAHFEDELQGYKRAKGSVQFPLNEPIPYELISRMVQFRYDEILTANKTES